jgi:hypothetical protein
MLKDINVRFFALLEDEPMEINHEHFVDLYAAYPEARIDIEKHSVFGNGVRQLCITINQEFINA